MRSKNILQCIPEFAARESPCKVETLKIREENCCALDCIYNFKNELKGGLCPSTHSRPLNAFSIAKVALRRYIFRPIHLTYSFDPGIKLKVISRATSATIPHPSILDRLKNID